MANPTKILLLNNLLILFNLNLIFGATEEYEIENGIEDYPYNVGLYIGFELYCTGAFVSRRWVLTAAHCNYKPLEYASAKQDDKAKIKHKYYIKISKVKVHPEYKPQYINDIALVELESDITFDYQAKAATLPPENYEVKSNTELESTGWWRQLNPNDWLLQKTGLKSLSDGKCNQTHNANKRNYTNTNMCVWQNKFFLSYTDFIGPIVTKGKMLVGIRSYVMDMFPEESDIKVVVATKVSHHRKWIDSVVPFV